MKCPYCKDDIEIKLESISWHKHGRTAPCPKCKQTILFHRFVNPIRNRPKHMSKKERLRERVAGK
jgi:hypothetical protein